MTTPQASTDQQPTLMSRDMVLLCLAQAAGYGASAFLAPLLPLYLVSRGHTESYVGLVLAAFNVASFPSRPVWGVLSDRGWLRGSLTASGLLVGTAYLGYLVPNAAFIFLVRMVQGVGWGGVNVVGSAWAALLAPATRRAEALGWYTMAQRTGTALGPISALWVLDHFGFEPAFLVGACVAYMIAVAAFLTRPAAAINLGPAQSRGSGLRSFIEPGALLGAALITLMSSTGPAMNAYMPLYFRNLGLSHIELYYIAYGVTGIACRPIIGTFADRIGRMQAISLGFGLQLVGMSLLALSADFPGIVAGMMVHTVGYAISEPSLYALGIDGSPANRRGAAMATITMAFQLGGGIGFTLSGFLFEFVGYREAYTVLLLPVSLALIVSLWVWRRRRRAAAVTSDSA